LNKPGQISISIVVIAGFFIVLYFFMSIRVELPSVHRELIAGMIGALTMKFGTVLDWWFGSSFGSSRKTDVIAEMNKPIDLTNEVK
jgi:protein-S-isoprenylcysteine O-methyltransferase Ste14